MSTKRRLRILVDVFFSLFLLAALVGGVDMVAVLICLFTAQWAGLLTSVLILAPAILVGSLGVVVGCHYDEKLEVLDGRKTPPSMWDQIDETIYQSGLQVVLDLLPTHIAVAFRPEHQPCPKPRFRSQPVHTWQRHMVERLGEQRAYDWRCRCGVTTKEAELVSRDEAVQIEAIKQEEKARLNLASAKLTNYETEVMQFGRWKPVRTLRDLA